MPPCLPNRLLALPLLAGACAMPLAMPAAAQNIKPGLWEMSNRMKTDNPETSKMMAEVQKQMAGMPPEQRKQMEAAMAQHGGVKFQSSGDGSMRIQLCMTRELIQDTLLGKHKLSGQCTQNRPPVVGNTMRYSFTCANPPSSGEGKVTFNGDSAYTSTMSITSSPAGKKETMTVDTTARWLGADCGTVKPLTLPPAAAQK